MRRQIAPSELQRAQDRVGDDAVPLGVGVVAVVEQQGRGIDLSPGLERVKRSTTCAPPARATRVSSALKVRVTASDQARSAGSGAAVVPSG